MYTSEQLFLWALLTSSTPRYTLKQQLPDSRRSHVRVWLLCRMLSEQSALKQLDVLTQMLLALSVV
jgi:hypothetical protein